MKRSAVLALAILAGACSSALETHDEDVTIASAQFTAISFTTFTTLGTCGSACDSTLAITADGRLSYGEGFAGMMSEEDRATFVAWASSQELVDALMAPPDCGPSADGGLTIQLELRPGMFVGAPGNRGACDEGPIGAIVARANALGRRYVGEGSAEPLPAEPRIQHPERAARLTWDAGGFKFVSLFGTAATGLPSGPGGGVAADGAATVTMDTGDVVEGQAETGELERVRALAGSQALLDAWPGTCAAPVAGVPDMVVVPAPDVRLETSLTGCADGPVTALAAEVRGIVQRVAATAP